MTTVTLTGINNATWDLTNGNSPVQLAKGGITGLIGAPEAVTTRDTRFPGQVLHHLTTPPLEGSLSLTVDRQVGLRGIIAAFSPARPARLRIDTWETPIRLAGAINAPEVDPDDEPNMDVTIPLIGDTGAWKGPVNHETTIINDGDIPITPWFTWTGTATITLPSGLTLNLPNAPTTRTLRMSEATGNTILDGTTPDLNATADLPSFVEHVPPGTTKTFLTAGATIHWQKGVWNPWT